MWPMSTVAEFHATPEAPAAPSGQRRRARWWQKLSRWVPVRTLGERHRAKVRQHLLELTARDRYLRFGYHASDETIERYVAALDFERDQLFGIFNRHLQLIATSHVAYAEEHGRRFAEFAVSVRASARGRGYGARLFAHAVVHARNRGVHRMLIHALSENEAMLRIAQNAGARVQREGTESDAWLALPPDTLASHVEELVIDKAAELNYGVKFESRRLARLERRVMAIGRRWLRG